MDVIFLIQSLPFSPISAYLLVRLWQNGFGHILLPYFLMTVLLVQLCLAVVFLFVFHSGHIGPDSFFANLPVFWAGGGLVTFFILDRGATQNGYAFFRNSPKRTFGFLVWVVFLFCSMAFMALTQSLTQNATPESFTLHKALLFLLHEAVFLISLGLFLFVAIKTEGRNSAKNLNEDLNKDSGKNFNGESLSGWVKTEKNIFFIFYTNTAILFYFALRQLIPIIEGSQSWHFSVPLTLGVALTAIGFFIADPKATMVAALTAVKEIPQKKGKEKGKEKGEKEGGQTLMSSQEHSSKKLSENLAKGLFHSVARYLPKLIQFAVLPLFLAVGIYMTFFGVQGSLWGNSQSQHWKNIKELSDKIKSKNYTVKWHSSLNSAYKIASAEKTWVLIDLWAEWCVACHKMEKEFFQSPQFVELAADANLILVRLDFTEETDETRKLANRYDIVGLPTVILTDAKGDMVGSLIGYTQKKKSLDKLNDLLTSKQIKK